MHFTSERLLDDGVLERDFLHDQIPGLLWTPPPAPEPTPLILLGHPGGQRQLYPRLAARARSAAQQGIATAAIELPGSGDRPPIEAVDRARTDLRSAIMAGDRPTDEMIDELLLPLAERSVPEWRSLLDLLLALPDIDGPVGWSGGLVAVGTRLARVEPRIAAVGLFAGSWIPRSTFADAQAVTAPVHVLLQWDDSGNDRQQAIDLYDAFGSAEKTLYVSLGGHTGVPQHAGEDAGRFFARHLNPVASTDGP